MKAVVFHEFGGLDVLQLEDVDDPKAGAGEVVLDVTASALNHLDVDIREGVSRFPIELPHILGVEVVGRVAEIGEGVTGWQEGDRAMVFLMNVCKDCRYCRTGRESLCVGPGFVGFSTTGGYAEKIAVSAGHLVAIPDGLPDEQAAALQIAFGTAWHMLFARGRSPSGRDGPHQLRRQRHRLGRGAAGEHGRRDDHRHCELRREARAGCRAGHAPRHQPHARRTSSARSCG